MEPDIFCSLYSRWKKEGKVIYENEYVYAILSVTPAMPLHSTIIVKRHVEDEGTLTQAEARAIFQALKKTFEVICEMRPEQITLFYTLLKKNPPVPESADLAEWVLKDQNLFSRPVAYNVGINCGKEAGQIVNHFHLHLFPIRKAGFGVVTALRNQYKANQ